MSSTADEDPVEAFGAYGPDPPLGEPVGSRRTDRCADHRDALGPEHFVEGPGGLGVSVPDQEPGGRGPIVERARQVARLLGDPRGIRVGCHADYMHPSGVKLDEEQDVERPQSEGLHGEEVAGESALGLSPEKLRPGRSGPPRAGPRPWPLRIRRMVVAPMRIPSLRSSPWIRT
jgi:hypothetical protein